MASREIYTAALELVRQIENDVSGHNHSDRVVPLRFYRRRSDGAIMMHLGQIVNAILEDDLAEPHTCAAQEVAPLGVR